MTATSLPRRSRQEAARCRAMANNTGAGKRENFFSLAEQYEQLAQDIEASELRLH